MVEGELPVLPTNDLLTGRGSVVTIAAGRERNPGADVGSNRGDSLP
jgi:hypothetical protein